MIYIILQNGLPYRYLDGGIRTYKTEKAARKQIEAQIKIDLMNRRIGEYKVGLFTRFGYEVIS